MSQNTNPGGTVVVFPTDLESQVLKFMQAAEQLNVKGFPPFHDDFRQDRWKMLMGPQGEVNEYVIAEAQDDLPETVDGLIDMMWVIMGTLYSYVGPDCARALLNEVARANMSKVDGSLAPMEKDDNGKVIKPKGWTAPDMRGVLESHGWKMNEKGQPLHD